MKLRTLYYGLMILGLALILVLIWFYRIPHLQETAILLRADLEQTQQLNNGLLVERDHLLFESDQLKLELDRLLTDETETGTEEQPASPSPGEGPGQSSGPGVDLPGGQGPVAYLTIDDGPCQKTYAILEILAEYGIPATFFVTGNNRTADSSVYRSIVSGGHALGNHTYSHNYQRIYRSVEDFMADFLRLEDFLYRETGARTQIMRFPGGASGGVAARHAGYDIIPELIAEITARGYDYFDWQVTFGDSSGALPASRLVEIALQGIEQQRGGNLVILLHDGPGNTATVEALPVVVEHLLARGYSFAPLEKGIINVKHR